MSAISLSFIFDDEIFDFPSDIGGFRLSQMLDGSSSDAIFQYEMNIVDDRINIEIYSTNFAVSDSIINLGVLLPIMGDEIDFTDIDTESVIVIDNDIIAINGSTVLDGLNLFTENGSFILKEGLFDLMKEKQYYQKPSFKKRERAKRRKINIKKAEKLRQNFI